MLFVLLAACGTPVGGCDILETARSLAGDAATDCGFVEDAGDGTEAWGCALAAHESGTPFLVRYERSGIDTTVVNAMVSDGAKVWILQQEIGGNANTGIDGWDCVDPVESVQEDDAAHDGASGYPILTCTSREPTGNHYQVCGPICGPESCHPQPLPFEAK